MIRTVLASCIRRCLYPGYEGRPQWADPTGGTIDRDIQWKVDTFRRVGDGRALTRVQRSDLETELQRVRDKRKAGR